jgi:hypothetical protein
MGSNQGSLQELGGLFTAGGQSYTKSWQTTPAMETYIRHDKRLDKWRLCTCLPLA